MLILIGASASGKTEVAKLMAKKYKITKVVTYTTRAIRVNEVNHVDYNFVSVEEFAKLNNEDFFVETTYYNNNYYGTAKKDITDDKLVILDPNGLKSFKALNDDHIIAVLLSCSEEVRYQRMINRLDKPENAKNRILNDRIAFANNKLDTIDFVVDSEHNNIEELTDKVYQLYISKIK